MSLSRFLWAYCQLVFVRGDGASIVVFESAVEFDELGKIVNSLGEYKQVISVTLLQ